MASTVQRRSEFHRLMAKVQSGDAEAARRLYEQYGNYLIHVVRTRLHPRLRSKFDSIDFTQDVWGSFFTRVVDTCEVKESGDLIKLLCAMARNKVIEVSRAHTGRRKYRSRREASLVETHGGADLVPDVQHTPSQIMMGEEAWNRLLAEQPPVYRRILLLLRDGYSHERIVAELGVQLRTVQRVIRKVAP